MSERHMSTSMEQVLRQGMHQRQSLIMSAQMQQSIDMLMMNTLDLERTITQQLEDNPMLELAESEIETPATTTAPTDDFEDYQRMDEDSRLAAFEKLDTEWSNVFDTSEPSSGILGSALTHLDAEHGADVFELIVAPQNLSYYLQQQLDAVSVNEDVRKAAGAVIHSLDHHGFFKEDTAQLAAVVGMDKDTLQHALSIVRGFEPQGIGASGVREALLSQLENIGSSYPFAQAILDCEDFYQLFLQNRRADLTKMLGCSSGALDYTYDLLRSFNPYPAYGFGGSLPRSLSADVIVRKEDGVWSVSVAPGKYRRLRLNTSYLPMLRNRSLAPSDTQYFKDKYDRATELLINIAKRNETLLNVAGAIVNRQTEFLDNGVASLKPMKMTEIADELGHHEATVSRTVGGKYLDTPHGLFELRFFFSRGIGADDDGTGGASSLVICMALKTIIDQEDCTRPYQDAEIVDLLLAKGYKLARRTVAKYRSAMKIPSAKFRKTKS